MPEQVHQAPDFRTAAFSKSAARIDQCPPDSLAEVAFAGRSNAGKSSAINRLTENRKLARTSKTPGRTQLINYFELDTGRYLVDLPGYGYAKVPQAVKQQWQKELARYLEQRQPLKGLILLMDVRHPLQEFDQMMLEWAGRADMPVHILLTKADKLKRGPASSSLLKVKAAAANMDGQISVQLFSALKGDGLPELRSILYHWFEDKPGA